MLNFRNGDAVVVDETGVVVVVVVVVVASTPSSSSNPDKSCSSLMLFKTPPPVPLIGVVMNGFVLSFSFSMLLFATKDADKFALLMNDNSVMSISDPLREPFVVAFFNHVIRTLHRMCVPLSIRISCALSNPPSLKACTSFINFEASSVPRANVVLFPTDCSFTLYAFGSNWPFSSRYKVTICVSLLFASEDS